jgi:hypothetical protein
MAVKWYGETEFWYVLLTFSFCTANYNLGLPSEKFF